MLLEEVLKAVEVFPNDVAVMDESGNITYRDLWDLSLKFAGRFSRDGVGKGDFISIELPRSINYVAAMIGCWMVGAAFAALDISYPSDRLDYIAEDCGSKIRVTSNYIEGIENEPKIEKAYFPSGEENSFLVYTSGSTGRPKGVLHSHQSIFDSVVRGVEALDSLNRERRGQILGVPVPFSFIVGVSMLFGGMRGGLPVYIIPVVALRDPILMDKVVFDNNISVAYMPPKTLKVFRNEGGCLKTAIVGSEKVSGIYRDDIAILNIYGSSETAGGVTYFHIDKEYENTPIGKPYGGTKVYVLDENGKECEEGEICIAGHFAKCYLNDPVLTKERFVLNPFKERDGFDTLYRSGDIGKCLPSGDYLYVNRKDWMIKINGQRVEPGEIEATIRSVGGVFDAAVKDFVGAAGQTYLAAYYVLEGEKEIDVKDIKAAIASRLPSYMMPAHFIKLDKLPTNANGKLDRKSLKAPIIESMVEYVAPRDEVEKELCKGFEQALNMPKVGCKDDFFDLGGDSIRVMVLERICSNLKLSTKMIYDLRTVEKIAKAVKEAKAEEIDIDLRHGTFPLTQAQLGIFLSCEQREGEVAYNNPILLRFKKEVDAKRLQKAVEQTVLNHPGLFAKPLIDEQGLPAIRYEEAFEKEEICDLYDIKESDFAAIKKTLLKPFFIKRDRLFRFAIYKSEACIRLFMDIHHIVFDGYSMKILLSEIASIYHGTGVAPETFTAFHASISEAKEREGEGYAKAKEWYLNTFGGVEEISLPKGDENGNETIFGHSKIALGISPQKIKEYCLDHQTTDNALTAAAFGYLLSVYCMSKKASFATVYNGRHDVKTARTVSMFVRTLPVLCEINPALEVDEFVKATKDQMMGAMVNDTYSFRELASATGYSSDVLFTYQGDLFEVPNWGDLTCERESIEFNATGEKLSIQLYPLNGKLILDIQYHGNLYSEKWISDFASRYEKVLSAFLSAKTLGEVALVDSKEEKKLLALSYGGDLPFDKTKTFVDLVSKSVSRFPTHRAVVAKNGVYTYSNLDLASNIIANHLVKIGVKEGDFVALKMSRIKEFEAAILGVMKAGGAYVPVDPAYPEERIAYMVEDSKAKALLTDEKVAAILEAEENKDPINLSKPDSPAYMIYTSGSTGKPKGVVIRHVSLAAFVAWNIEVFHLTHESVNGEHASFSFDASVGDLFPVLAAGGELHILGEDLRMDLDLIYEYLQANKVTGLTMSTQIGLSLINAHPDVGLQYMICGGEKFLPTAKTKVRMVNGYGPTEFTVCSSFQFVDQEKEGDVPIGRAVPNSYSLICDQNGNLLPQGMTGELCLSGIQISQGYYGRDELNKEKFVARPFLNGEKMYRTGDLARYNEDGVLEYLGRIDFMVKLRGFRIELGEIESVASRFEGVKQVIALVKNKQIVLYFTADREINTAELKSFMASSLTEYMVPNVFMQLDTMPLNPSGKIDRKALPEIEKTGAETIPPRNEDEKKIFEILAKVIGNEDFGVEDDFGDIGLTSLSAMQFSSLLASTLNKPLRASDLTKYPTIASLAKHLSVAQSEESYALQEDYPLTMAQRGILTEAMAHPGTTIYNIPVAIELPKAIDLIKFENAISEAIDAHPYLKGRIVANDDGDFRIKRNDESKIEIAHVDLDALEGGAQVMVKPFDVIGGELVRAALLLGKDRNVFFFDAHHIAFDGESLDVLMNDINDAYMGKTLQKESFSEFEYALAEEKYRQDGALQEAKNHYMSLLDGRDVDCLLIKDIQASGIGKQEINLAMRADQKQIEKYLESNKTTVNTLWISALGVAIAKFLHREDALYTTVYNGRGDARVKRDVGMFVHTLPVVAEPYKSPDAATYVKSMGEQIQNSMANDIYSFMEIAHDFGVRADILFVYEGKIAQGYQLGGIDIPSAESLSPDEMKASILLAVSDSENGFGLHLEYDGDAFEAWSMSSFLNAVVACFNAILQGKDLKKLSLLSAHDRKIIDASNATEVKIEKDDIVTSFRKMAKRYPDNIAIIYKDIKLTYAEVDETTDRIAERLLQSGIGKGKVASVLVSRSQNMVLSALGVLKTGAAYQPLDFSYPTDRLLFMIKDANAAMLIADRNLMDRVPGCNLDVLYTEDFAGLPAKTHDLPHTNWDDLFILLYTSGTTGTPKGVMLKHSNLANFCAWHHRYYGLSESSVVSAYAGFGFDACMMDLYPALTAGAAVCIVPDELRMNLSDLKDYFAKNRVSHSFMTTQVGRLFASEHPESSLSYLSVGGEKLTPVEPPKDYKLINGYGPTECTIFSTTKWVDRIYPRIPIGQPLDNYKLYVVDESGNEVPLGALGELWISGLGVGEGYLNQPEKTAQSFIKNPFSDQQDYARAYRSGDIVRRLADGSIDFIGRNDGQVKVRGFRIELSEVEVAIRSFPGIKDVTVQAFDAEGGGKFLAAYFTSDKHINIEDIKQHILADKPSYMVPASIMQLDQIPLNQNQKVNKRALPKPVFDQKSSEYVQPSSPAEKDFCTIFEQVLGLEKVSADASFFDLGGTSLTAAKVVISAMNKGYSVSYQDIFSHPTAIELAAFATNAKKEDEAKPETNEIASERESLKYNVVAHVDEIVAERKIGRVLLTGATGFLGVHVFRELLERETPTIILVRGKGIDPIARAKGLLMYYFDDTFDDVFDRFVKVIDADITDENLLDKLGGEQFDTIINAAAIVKHFASDDSIERVNHGGVKNLIKVAEAKKARLIQVSTISVAGENIGHKFPETFAMKENQLYFGQDLSNKYASSKFNAEDSILTAIEKGELDAKIIRVGNLMGRQSDGEFQINSITNAFMRNLRGYKALGKFPISMLDGKVDFSPIDEIAKTILLLAETPSRFTVFHSYNSHMVQMGDVIDAMNLCGIHIDKVSDQEFAIAMREAMQDESLSEIVSPLLSYASSDNLSHEFIPADATYSVKALYRLGYRWPITDFEYLIKAIEALDTLGFFDGNDM